MSITTPTERNTSQKQTNAVAGWLYRAVEVCSGSKLGSAHVFGLGLLLCDNRTCVKGGLLRRSNPSAELTSAPAWIHLYNLKRQFGSAFDNYLPSALTLRGVSSL